MFQLGSPFKIFSLCKILTMPILFYLILVLLYKVFCLLFINNTSTKQITYICRYGTVLSEDAKGLPLDPRDTLEVANSSLLILLYPVGPVG